MPIINPVDEVGAEQYIALYNQSNRVLMINALAFLAGAMDDTARERIETLIGSGNIALAAGVIRPDISGGLGQPITWNFLFPPGDGSHNKIYFSPTITASSSAITVNFPTAENVIFGAAMCDEVLASQGIFLGTAVALDHMDIYAYRKETIGGKLQNDGVNWFGDNNTVSNVTYNAGSGEILLTTQAENAYKTTSVYAGKNTTRNLYTRNLTAGLGVGQVKMYLVDPATGAVITAGPNIDDAIDVVSEEINTGIVANTLTTDNQNIWTVSSNIWVFAIFELPAA